MEIIKETLWVNFRMYKVDKLTGLDMMSRDGSIGLFTKRIINSTKEVLIGDKDTYMSVNHVSI